MDPTEAELGAITDLAGARAWAGVDGDLWTSLGRALGDPARVREVVLVQRPLWDRTVAAVRIPTGPAPDGGGDPPTRDLTPVELARVESLRRVCHILMGHRILQEALDQHSQLPCLLHQGQGHQRPRALAS